MDHIYEKWFQQDLRESVQVRHCEDLVFCGDANTYLVGVVLRESGGERAMSGSVVCKVKRPDQETVVFTGTLDGAKASAVLPKAALVYPGLIDVVLQLVDGEDVMTVLKAVFMSEPTGTDQAVDPGHAVPDLTQLLAQIDEMAEGTTRAEAAAEAAEEAAEAANASAQDITSTKILLSADKTASGNPAVLTDSRNVPIKTLAVTINPKRELHGYDNPWIGGTRKNKLQVTAQSSGIFKVKTDGDGNKSSIIVNGAPSDLVRFGNGFYVAAGEYILTGCPSNGAENKYNLSIRSDSVNGAVIGGLDIGSGANVTIPADGIYYYAITIAAGQSNATRAFWPMLRLATVEDSTYEPYSNVTHISGSDKVCFTVSGKNILDAEHPYAVGKAVNSFDGTIEDEADYNLYKMPVVKGQAIKVAYYGTGVQVMAAYYDIDGKFLGYEAALHIGTNAPASMVDSLIPQCNGHMLLALHNECTDIRASYSAVSIDYEAYKGFTHEIQLPGAAGSAVYGGILTVNEDGSGTLKVDRIKVRPTVNDVTMVNNSGYRFRLTMTTPGEYVNLYYTDVLSNLIPTITEDQVSGKETLKENFCYNNYTAGGVIYWNTQKAYASIADMLADFPGLEFVYYLRDQQTYQISAETLTTYEGGTVVVADPFNSMEIVYRGIGIQAGSVSLDEAQLQALLGIVQSMPVVTEQPKSVYRVDAGSDVTFTVAAENAMGYQWQTSTDIGKTWTDTSGTDSTYIYTTPSGSGTIYLRCRVIGTNGLIVYSDRAVCTWW